MQLPCNDELDDESGADGTKPETAANMECRATILRSILLCFVSLLLATRWCIPLARFGCHPLTSTIFTAGFGGDQLGSVRRQIDVWTLKTQYTVQ